MKKSIIKSVLIVAIVSGGIGTLMSFADGTGKDGTTFTTTSNGNTVIDHSASGGSKTIIDGRTGRKATTSN